MTRCEAIAAVQPKAHESRPMQRSTGMVCDVVDGKRKSLENQDRHVIEVKENTNQPKNPDVSQCSSTGSSQFHNVSLPSKRQCRRTAPCSHTVPRILSASNALCPAHSSRRFAASFVPPRATGRM